MKQTITLIAFICFAFSSHLFSQDGIYILSDEVVSCEVDEIVTVEFSVENLNDVLGTQGTITFDPDELQVVSTDNNFPPGVSNVNVNNTNGTISFGWFNVPAQDIDDGEVLITIDFQITNPGIAATHVIGWGSSPTPNLVTQEIGGNITEYTPDTEEGSITVEDTDPPSITCPANLEVEIPAGETGVANLDVSPVDVSDNCAVDEVTYTLSGATVSSGSDNASGETFNLGVTTVEYTVSDFGGLSASCDFTVTVSEESAPVEEVALSMGTGIELTCDETFDFPLFVDGLSDIETLEFSVTFDSDAVEYVSASDNLTGGTLTIDDSQAASGQIGFSFDNGAGYNEADGFEFLTLTFDVISNTAQSLSFEYGDVPVAISAANTGGDVVDVVTTNGNADIIDITAPVVVCPDDVEVEIPAGTAPVAVENIEPVETSDNCGVDVVEYYFDGVLEGNDDASGSLFGLGTTSVSYLVSDVNGNTAECFFDVTITEEAAPGEINLTVSDETTSCDESVSVSVSADGITDIEDLSFSISFDETLLSYDAATSNLSGGSFTIDDSQAGSGSIGFSWNNGAGFNESNGFDILTLDFNAIGLANANSNIDVTDIPVSISASDTSGNSVTVNSVNGNVSIEDNEAPTITCPDDVIVDAEEGADSEVVEGIAPVDFDDNCEVGIVTYDLVGATTGSGDDDASGTDFNIGSTNVTYSVEDGVGNLGSCDFSVTVNETIAESDTITLVLSNEVSDCGNEVTLEVSVFNFNDVEGAQFSINWDTENFSFVDAQEFFPQGTSNINDFDGSMSISWVGSSLSLGNDTVIMTLTLEAFGPEGLSDVIFSDDPLDIELSNIADGQLPVVTVDGSVNISDNENPEVVCPDNVSVTAPFGATEMVVEGIAPVSVSDDCGIESVEFLLDGVFGGNDDASGMSFDTGTTVVTYVAEDVNGNSAECDFEVTVEAADPGDEPLIFVLDYIFDCNVDQVVIPVQVANFGDVLGAQFSVNWDETVLDYDTVEAAPVLPNANFNLDFTDEGKLAISWASGSPLPISNGDDVIYITFNVIGASGVSSAIEITDDPIDIEVSNVDGILPHQVENGSVLYEDTEAPTVVCPEDQLVQVENLGDPSVAVEDIEATTDDNCEVTSLDYEITGATTGSGSGDASGTHFNLGESVVTYTATDDAGNTAECSFEVEVKPLLSDLVTFIVEDVTSSCGEDFIVNILANDFIGIGGVQFTVTWDADVIELISIESLIPSGNGAVNFNEINPGVLLVSWVGDEDVTLLPDGSVLFEMEFEAVGDFGESTVIDIVDAPTPIEVSSIDPLVNDIDYAIISGGVEIVDLINPIAVCDDISIDLDANGEATISADDVDGGSSDNCGDITLAIDNSSFDCSDVGANTVVLTVTDQAGNESTCESVVTVEDNTAPDALCQDVTVELDTAGLGSITAADVDNGSFDNCDPITLAVDVSDFDCADVGDNAVILTVTDPSGNETTCEATVTVEDNIAPNALCQDVTVELDTAGLGSITATDVDNGSSDNCDPVALAVDVSDFDCSDVGDNAVILTVTDPSGNETTCEATVTVEDNIAPNALCQDVTVELDTAGLGSITANDIDNGSFDNCDPITLAVDVSDFDCADVGDNAVILTVTDPSGNESTCEATVTVEDNIAPNALCQDVTVELDTAGLGSITANDIDNGSFDNCNPITLAVDVSDFDCSDIGENTVILTVTDPSGNESTCEATVTVEDNLAPIALCQDATVELNASGLGSITAQDVDNGSFDNCDPVVLAIDVSDFDCSDVGENTVTLTVTDPSGNATSCQATVTVEDNIAPDAICQDLTVELDTAGLVSITAEDVDNGSFDNCDPITLSVDVSDFDCSDVGENTVILTVTDPSGNESTCEATVTVEDNIAPTAICQDFTLILDVDGEGSITGEDVDGGSFDNCDPITLEVDITDFGCVDVGENNVVLTVTDPSGNESTCDAIVTVVDDMSPDLECVDSLTIALDENGFAELDFDDVITSVMTPCGVDTTYATVTEFNCDLVGGHDLTLTVEDPSGNISECDFHLTVVDDIPPVLECVDSLDIILDGDGFAALDLDDVVTEVSDACGIDTFFANVAEYDCSLVGEHDLTITAIDGSGNESTCGFHLTVIDDSTPIIECADEIDAFLDEDGEVVLDINELLLSASDNCAIVDTTATQLSFECGDVGENIVTVEVADENGNVSSCEVTVDVIDNLPPVVICNDITVELDADGEVLVTADDVDGGTTDNCGLASIDPEFVILTCDDVGENTYVGTVTDVNGNTATCEVTVTVEDNSAPVANCADDFELELDVDTGFGSISVDDINDGSTDNCGENNLTFAISQSTFGPDDVGENEVVLTVTDENGNVSTCITIVTVLELPPCEITCPDDIVVSNDPGECNAFVDVPDLELMGFCITPTFNLIFSEDFDGCSQPAGWVNTTTSTGSTVAGTCDFALFSYTCTNGLPFGGPAVPATFDGCQAVIDDDAPGSSIVGVHCIESPEIDLSVDDASTLSFDYQNREIVGNGEFTAEVWNGASWDVLFTETESASGSGIELDISAYDNSDFKVRFCYDDQGSWAWGAAVDNVQMFGFGDPQDPVIVNDFNDTDNASGVYPVGTTDVTYSVEGTDLECTFSVTVNDDEPPVVNCPSDIIVDLNPGECDRIVNYTVTSDDNCPFAGPGGTVNTITDGGNGGSVGGAVYLDIENVSGNDLVITEFGMNISAATMVDIYVKPGTHVGSVNNPGAWTFIGTADATTGPFSGPFPGTGVITPAETDIVLPPGLWGVALHTPTASNNYTNGNGLNQFFSDANIELSLGSASNTLWGFPFNPRVLNGYVTYESASTGGEIVQTLGLPTGSVFEVGTTTNCFEVEDNAGNLGSCCFDVTVQEFDNPTANLACNDLVNVSVDENCQALINADMILEGGPYGCYDDYELEIETQGGVSVSNPIGPQWVGETLIVTVHDAFSDNSCWGYIQVEDKIKPTIECRDLEVVCGDIIPNEPAPGIDGPQTLVFDDLNDVVGAPANPGSMDYEFDYNYLPLDATVLDVDVRIKLDHTWATDLDISIQSPDGTTVSVFNVTGGAGCLLAAITIDCTFDDDGAAVTDCNGLNVGGDPVQPMMGVAVPFQPLGDFDGEDARGVWTVTITDNIGGDDAFIEIVGMTLSVNAPTIEPADNCGPVDVDFTEVVEDFNDCDSEFGQIITRTWTATDIHGNQSSCDQTISVGRVALEDLQGPPNFDGIDNPALSCTGNWDLNGNGFPDPEETSGFENSCDNIVFTFEDLFFDACGEGAYKILRKWLVFDWCTDEIAEFNQLIKVVNDTEPEIVCPPSRTISTGSNACEAIFFPPAPVELSDECSNNVDYSIESSAGVIIVEDLFGLGEVVRIEGVPVGVHTLTYTADDGCGNTSTCETNLTVEDRTAPIAICDLDTRVSLGIDGNAQVNVAAWDDGSYDNCGIAGITARRKDGPRACGNTGAFVPTLNFCCDDLNEVVDVQVRVTDIWGNFNDCWVSVYVENKVAPTITCPTDVTISCVFEFDLDKALNDPDYDVLGKVATPQTGEDAQIRAIDPGDGSPVQNIFDGEAFGACDIDVTVSLFGPEPGCGPVESFVRRYRAFDPSSQYSGTPPFCDQVVTILNNNQFDGDRDITWPADVPPPAISGCNGQDEPWNDLDITGEPTFRNENCAQIGVSYQDQLFTVVDDACFKILRTWKVIDWCVHDANAGIGEWTYVQTIKVMDDGAPVMNNAQDVTIVDSTSSDCTAFVDFEADITDCSPMDVLEENSNWKIDAFNTGVFDIFSTERRPDNSVRENLRIEENLPFGTHRVQWVINDACGNTTVEEFLLTLVDGKLPSPVCLNGIATVVMPAGGCIEIEAEDFDAGSFDNCTEDEDLIFTFHPHLDSTSKVFCCDELGTNLVEIWVTDEAGNQDFCETFILIQDPNEACGNISIAGHLETEFFETIGDADVELNRNGDFFDHHLTLEDGRFLFEGIDLNSDYSVTPEKDINPLNGVTTYDIALIQRHILNIEHLDSPYKLIAADVRPDGSINVLDIADLRALILGKSSEFAQNTSWKFVSSDQQFDGGMLQPPHPSQIETSREYFELPASVRDADFVGVKIGDVNNSNSPNSAISSESRSYNNPLGLVIDNFAFAEGDLVEVEFRASDFDQVLGYQFTLNFNSGTVEFNGFENGRLDNLSENNFGLHLLSDGMITTSWNNSDHQTLTDGDVVFSLTFTAKRAGKTGELFSVSSAITASEAYKLGEGIVDISLKLADDSGLVDSDVFALYQNTPNPFSEETSIGFVVPVSVSGTLTIYDVTGKVVKVFDNNFERGYNQINLNRGDLPASGVYYYQLEAGDYNATKKLMLIE